MTARRVWELALLATCVRLIGAIVFIALLNSVRSGLVNFLGMMFVFPGWHVLALALGPHSFSTIALLIPANFLFDLCVIALVRKTLFDRSHTKASTNEH